MALGGTRKCCQSWSALTLGEPRRFSQPLLLRLQRPQLLRQISFSKKMLQGEVADLLTRPASGDVEVVDATFDVDDGVETTILFFFELARGRRGYRCAIFDGGLTRDFCRRRRPFSISRFLSSSFGLLDSRAAVKAACPFFKRLSRSGVASEARLSDAIGNVITGALVSMMRGVLAESSFSSSPFTGVVPFCRTDFCFGTNRGLHCRLNFNVLGLPI
jgi:hypothetical protein